MKPIPLTILGPLLHASVAAFSQPHLPPLELVGSRPVAAKAWPKFGPDTSLGTKGRGIFERQPESLPALEPPRAVTAARRRGGALGGCLVRHFRSRGEQGGLERWGPVEVAVGSLGDGA